MSDKEKGKAIPEHLRSLFAETSEQGTERVEEFLNQEGQKVKTGRFGRAWKLSRMAAKGSSRWLADKALNAVSRDEEKVAARDKQRAIDTAIDMLKTMSEMRGAAMKIGQMLSYMDDILPEEARKLLSVLQRDAPPMSWEQLEEQFEEEFSESPDEIFMEFDRTPIAAASIGQVHRAKLHDGTPVAVKIQYPGIEEAMSADLKNAKFYGIFQQLMFVRTDTKAIMAEIEERMMDECNYEQEADYQDAFRKRFAGHPWIVVPEVHRMYSTRRILTTTFYEGKGFYEWLSAGPSQEDRQRTIEVFYRFYLGSFYLDGLFNCDPHPGNYLFLDDGRIVFLDYGCTRPFPDERRRMWMAYCRHVYLGHQEKVHELAPKMGFFKEGVQYDRDAFFELMEYFYRPYIDDEPFDFALQKPQNTFRKQFVENPNLFKLNMPTEAVFLNRISFGLVSLLAEIGGELNCRQHFESYLRGRDPDWPEDPILDGKPQIPLD